MANGNKFFAKINYDKAIYEWSNMYVGDLDAEGRIQWKYIPANRVLDFSGLKMKYSVELPEDLKVFYNAYFYE